MPAVVRRRRLGDAGIVDGNPQSQMKGSISLSITLTATHLTEQMATRLLSVNPVIISGIGAEPTTASSGQGMTPEARSLTGTCPHCSGWLYRDEEGMRRCINCSRSPDQRFVPPVPPRYGGAGVARLPWSQTRRDAASAQRRDYWRRRRLGRGA